MTSLGRPRSASGAGLASPGAGGVGSSGPMSAWSPVAGGGSKAAGDGTAGGSQVEDLHSPPADGSDFKIAVGVRLRPLVNRENRAKDGFAWAITPQTVAEVAAAEGNSQPRSFRFDHVFGPEMDTATLYDAMLSPIVQTIGQGYHATVFAYGQTGSGKTFSMMGTAEHPGVVPLSLTELFELLAENSETTRSLVRVSFLELYNEVINDLLNPAQTNLAIREDPVFGTNIDGATEVLVETAEHAMELLTKGLASRHVGETAMNEASSRSHSIFRLVIEAAEALSDDAESLAADAPRLVRTSMLNLIDLAGSERANKAGTSGERLREGASINKSLLTLGTVISALSNNSTRRKSEHVPYRNSKLTRLLQTSLGGNARTAVLCNVSPATSNVDETVNTLRFAQRVASIVNKVHVNEILDDKALIKKYELEMKKLKAELAAQAQAAAPPSSAVDSTLEARLQEEREQRERAEQRLKSLSELFLHKPSEPAVSDEVKPIARPVVRRATMAAPTRGTGGSDLRGLGLFTRSFGADIPARPKLAVDEVSAKSPADSDSDSPTPPPKPAGRRVSMRMAQSLSAMSKATKLLASGDDDDDVPPIPPQPPALPPPPGSPAPDVEARITELTRDKDALSEQLAVLKAQVTELTAANQAASSRHQAEVKRLNEQLATSRATEQSASKSATSLASELAAASAACAQAAADRDAALIGQAKLSATLRETQNELAQARAELAAQAATHARLDAEWRERDTGIRQMWVDARTKLHEKTAEAQRLHTHVTQLVETNSTLQGQLADKTADLEVMVAKSRALEAQIGKLRQVNDYMRGQLDGGATAWKLDSAAQDQLATIADKLQQTEAALKEQQVLVLLTQQKLEEEENKRKRLWQNMEHLKSDHHKLLRRITVKLTPHELRDHVQDVRNRLRTLLEHSKARRVEINTLVAQSQGTSGPSDLEKLSRGVSMLGAELVLTLENLTGLEVALEEIVLGMQDRVTAIVSGSSSGDGSAIGSPTSPGRQTPRTTPSRASPAPGTGTATPVLSSPSSAGVGREPAQRRVGLPEHLSHLRATPTYRGTL